MAELIIINSGPLITLARMDAIELLERLPYHFITPTEVGAEITAGKTGATFSVPKPVEIRSLTHPRDKTLFSRLDPGEAAVIQLALENQISTVCLDERKGRRVASDNGLRLLGSLGLLGRAKILGLVSEITPLIEQAMNSGIHYDAALLGHFLRQFGESWSAGTEP